MSRRGENLQKILQDLRDGGFGKETPTSELKKAIMRQVGVSLITIQQYKLALEAYGLMKPNKTGTVWVIQ